MRRTIAELEAELNDKRTRADALVASIERSGRTASPEERANIDGLLTQCRDLKFRVDRAKTDVAMTEAINNLTAGIPTTLTRGDGSGRTVAHVGGVPTMTTSLGQQFVDAFGDFFRRGGHRASVWRTEVAELFDPRLHAATLSTVTAGGDSLLQPQDRGLVPAPAPPPYGVGGLLGGGGTDSNAVVYLIEMAYVNAADTVAEGAAKPESTLTFEPRTDPVRKIAHWLPVTEEMLEDQSQMRGYIDSRLRIGVTLAEDDQLLQGSGVAPDLDGIRNRAGLAAAIARDAVGGESNADAIAHQISAIRVATSMEPDGVVLNPVNWAVIETSKDTAGSYLAGGPFSRLPGRRLWGVDVALSAAMPAGTALVGAFRTAGALFRKGGIRVEASNSHNDYFVKNLVAIRAETRIALAVYRPSAFGEVTGLV